jgi:hypothetical protein
LSFWSCCCCWLQSRKDPAEAAALAFAEAKLAYAAELAKEQGRSFAPELFFLQGTVWLCSCSMA